MLKYLVGCQNFTLLISFIVAADFSVFPYTGMEFFLGSKVQCLFCFETSTTEGRGEEMGGSGNFSNKAHRTFDPRNNSTPVFISG